MSSTRPEEPSSSKQALIAQMDCMDQIASTKL
jgi:hypothetical protein